MTENVLLWINAGWWLLTLRFPPDDPVYPNMYAAALLAVGSEDPPAVFAVDGTADGALMLLAILTPSTPLPLPPPSPGGDVFTPEILAYLDAGYVLCGAKDGTGYAWEWVPFDPNQAGVIRPGPGAWAIDVSYMAGSVGTPDVSLALLSSNAPQPPPALPANPWAAVEAWIGVGWQLSIVPMGGGTFEGFVIAVSDPGAVQYASHSGGSATTALQALYQINEYCAANLPPLPLPPYP